MWSELQPLEVCLSVEVWGRQSTVQSAVRHTDLVINHPQGRDGHSVLVVVEVVREVLHLGLGNSVHGNHTLQWWDDLSLGNHLLQVLSLGQSHRCLYSNFTERVTFVDKVQLVVIDSNVVEIIRDDVNRKSIETLLVIKDRDVNRFGLCGDSMVYDSNFFFFILPLLSRYLLRNPQPVFSRWPPSCCLQPASPLPLLLTSIANRIFRI